MQREPRKASPNPSIRQSNAEHSSRKDGVTRRICGYCDDNGVIPQRQYRRTYTRWYRRRAKLNGIKRLSEPHAHMIPCPVCQRGGLR